MSIAVRQIHGSAPAVGPAAGGRGFDEDWREFVAARMERIEPGKGSKEYEALDERSMRILAEIGAVVDVEVWRMSDRFDTIQAAMREMAAENAYWRGMVDGVRADKKRNQGVIARDVFHVGHKDISKMVRIR